MDTATATAHLPALIRLNGELLGKTGKTGTNSATGHAAAEYASDGDTRRVWVLADSTRTIIED